jgi:hypothetical protein
MAERGWMLTFHRWLNERNQTHLRQLRDILFGCPLSNDKDFPKWKWEKSGYFSVKSMYTQLCSSEIETPHKLIWKTKIPLKIKEFMWLIDQNAILTKDNLLRNWQGDLRCFSVLKMKASFIYSLNVI